MVCKHNFPIRRRRGGPLGLRKPSCSIGTIPCMMCLDKRRWGYSGFWQETRQWRNVCRSPFAKPYSHNSNPTAWNVPHGSLLAHGGSASSVKRRAARAVFMVDEVRSSMSRWVANHVSSIARTASADNMQSHRGSHDKAVPGSTVTKTKSRSLLWVVSIEDPAVTTSR